jgi:hypothetical protein
VNLLPVMDEKNPVDVEQIKELQDLKIRWQSEKDAIRRKYMQLQTNETDLDKFDLLDAAKIEEIRFLDAKFEALQKDLRERHHEKKSRSTVPRRDYEQQQTPDSLPSCTGDDANSRHKSEADDGQVLESVPFCEPTTQDSCIQIQPQFLDGQDRLMLHVQGLRDQIHKRKASPDVQNDDQPKRPRLRTDPVSGASIVVTPPAESRPGPSRVPSQEEGSPRIVQYPDVHKQRDQPVPERTISYKEVRRRALEEGHWDTIIEYPRNAKKWYILYCEEHVLHFKQGALAAAAKHLQGRRHGFPDRNRSVALAELGYHVVDCSDALQANHNAEVELAFKNGYVPVTKATSAKQMTKHLGETVAVPAGSSSPMHEAQRSHPVPSTERIGSRGPKFVASREWKSPTQDSKKKKTKRSIITDPKTFYVYYCDFAEEEDGEIRSSQWPVVILGWDDLTPGNMFVKRLFDTTLLDKGANPPKCYVYNDERDRIVGWKEEYGANGNPLKIRRRKFPVMFFDEHISYAWVEAKSISKFPLEAKNAPKTGKCQEKAFHDARHFIAKREGYRCWKDREDAKKKGQLGKQRTTLANR